MQEPGQRSELQELLASVERMLNAWEKRIPPSEEDTLYSGYRDDYNRLYRAVNSRDKLDIDATKLQRSLKELKEAIKNYLLNDIQFLFEKIDKLMSERVIDEPRRSEINSQLDAIRQRKGKIAYIKSENPEMILGTLDRLKNELVRYETKAVAGKGPVKSVVSDRDSALKAIKSVFSSAEGINPFKSTGIFNAIARLIFRTNHQISRVPLKYIVDYLVDKNTSISHIQYILAVRGRYDVGRDFLKELADNPKELERLIKSFSPEIRRMVHLNQIRLMTKARDRANLRKIMDGEVKVDEITGILKRAEQLVNADLNLYTTKQLEGFLKDVNISLVECRSVQDNVRKYQLPAISLIRFEHVEKELLLSRTIVLQKLLDKTIESGAPTIELERMLDTASEELKQLFKSEQSNEASSQAPISASEKYPTSLPEQEQEARAMIERIDVMLSSQSTLSSQKLEVIRREFQNIKTLTDVDVGISPILYLSPLQLIEQELTSGLIRDEKPQKAALPDDFAKRISTAKNSVEQSADQDQPPNLHKWAKKEVRTDENISGNSDSPTPDQKKP